MSYTRRFTKTIRVHYSGSVSYPASQSGGSVSYSGTEYEDVEFLVHVDTDPFDNRVDEMKHHVDLLTGTVVATESAHVKAKSDASVQIGNAIVRGFFKTVQSDISQQTMELKNKAEALLVQLNKLMEQCRSKSRQMGVDYRRLVDRYSKVFNDLDNELQNRIYSIDEPIYHTTRNTDEIAMYGTATDAVTTVTVGGAESARVSLVLSASKLKNQAMKAIDKGEKFLEVQYRADRLLDRSLRPGGEQATFATPYCLMEAVGGRGFRNSSVFVSPLLQECDSNTLKEKMERLPWNAMMSDSDREAIADYFNAQVADTLLPAAHTEHDRRVAAMTSSLFNLNSTRVPGE